MDNPWEMFNGVASRYEAVGKCEDCGGTEWLMVRTYLGHTSRYIETEHETGCKLAPLPLPPPNPSPGRGSPGGGEN